MLKRYFVMSVFAVTCAGAAVAAQTPTPADPQQPPTQTPQQPPADTPRQPPAPTPAEPREAPQAATTTLTGCVYQEADVAGRTPNVAERAGILEDYILADAKPKDSAASPSPTPGAVGTSGAAGTMYKLEKADDDQLKELVGKRVEVMGRIDAEAGDTANRPAASPGAPPQADKSAGPDRIELPELEVASIREVAGGAACPPKPSAR